VKPRYDLTKACFLFTSLREIIAELLPRPEPHRPCPSTATDHAIQRNALTFNELQ